LNQPASISYQTLIDRVESELFDLGRCFLAGQRLRSVCFRRAPSPSRRRLARCEVAPGPPAAAAIEWIVGSERIGDPDGTGWLTSERVALGNRHTFVVRRLLIDIGITLRSGPTSRLFRDLRERSGRFGQARCGRQGHGSWAWPREHWLAWGAPGGGRVVSPEASGSRECSTSRAGRWIPSPACSGYHRRA
jgi:hypothetical protein